MTKNPNISHFGDRVILLQWDFKICPEHLKILLSAKARVKKLLENRTVEVINTYKELVIIYPFAENTRFSDIKKLQEVDFKTVEEVALRQRSVEIPVCYDSHFGLDLEEVAREKGETVDTLVKLHTDPVYTVYFIGFLPGFPYLGGLDERLAFPRKKEPRPRIEKGAVGIAENQTGIYPNESPAGWQIIGNCPLTLFDPTASEPCLLKAGDKITFKAIGGEEHQRIKEAVAKANYELKTIMIDG